MEEYCLKFHQFIDYFKNYFIYFYIYLFTFLGRVHIFFVNEVYELALGVLEKEFAYIQ